MQINPFDQPNVQQAKDATKRGARRATEASTSCPPVEARGRGRAARAAARRGAAELRGDHGLHRALAPSSTQPSPSCARRSARPRRATTTFGYGPRFLHSTGQFHKGGPKAGRFLQLLHDGPADVEIPGAPYTFTTLKDAQAIGDLQTLRELGLPAEQLRSQGDDPAGAVRALTATIKEPK